MPGARTHDFITVVTVIGADACYAAKAPHPDVTLATLFTVAYLFAGFTCAGDLDLNSREYRRWGPLRIIWWPYQKLIPHRSPLSHGFFLGGLFRIFYILCFLSLLSWGGASICKYFFKAVNPDAFTHHNLLTLEGFVRAHPHEVVSGLLGFILAGTVHSISDIIGSWLKRVF